MSTLANPRFKPSGEAVAALMSPMIGLLALSIANLIWEAKRWIPLEDVSQVYIRIGSWIPRADKIGPFAGKETILLAAWGVTWLVLHLILRKRELRIAPWAIAFVIGIAAAVLLLWPPFTEILIPE